MEQTLAFYTFEVVLTPRLRLYSIHAVQPIISQSSELILILLTLKIPSLEDYENNEMMS